MAQGRERYWFVAAVFREPQDLAEAIAQMRAEVSLVAADVCVLANHTAEAAREAVAGSGNDRMPIVAIGNNGVMDVDGHFDRPTGMRALLKAMGGKGLSGGNGTTRPHIYAQLRQDVADGAFVLIAAVPGPEEQLLGARLLLKGNCECVLTHEIEAPHSA